MQTKEIKTIAIVGAGAMGAAYATMFADAGSFSFFFLAQGERYEKLRKGPLTVNGKSYSIDVRRPEDVKEPVDLVLVALKQRTFPRPCPLSRPWSARRRLSCR